MDVVISCVLFFVVIRILFWVDDNKRNDTRKRLLFRYNSAVKTGDREEAMLAMQAFCNAYDTPFQRQQKRLEMEEDMNVLLKKYEK